MIRFCIWIIKWCLATLLILIASHLIHWQGKSISDQVGELIVKKSFLTKSKFILPSRADLEKISAEERARLKNLLEEEQ